MAVPSRDWNENTPADTGQVSQGAADMRTIRDDVKDRLEREHVLNTSDSANDGYHLGGSAVLYTTTSAPTTAPDGTALVATAASSADAGRLWKPPGGRIRAYEKTTAAGTTLSWREAAPTVEETMLLATTQTVTGDKTFSGDVLFSGNFNVTTIGDSRTLTAISVGAVDTVIPAGIHYVWISRGVGTGEVQLQVQDSGATWNFVGGQSDGDDPFSQLVISDGTNVRVSSTGTAGYALRYVTLA